MTGRNGMERLFEHTLNTRPILENSLRFVRSDVPARVSEAEKGALIERDITTIVDLRTAAERAERRVAQTARKPAAPQAEPSVPQAGSAPLLVRTLITLRPAAGIQALSLLLSAVLGSLASTRQNRDLRALRRAMEEGEHVRTLPRNRWVWIEKGISLICLLLVFALHITDRDLPETKEYADDPLPYLSAAQVGGGEKEWCEVCRQRTVLGGTVSIVGEPPFGGMIGSWWTYGTELDFYAPRITDLAAPLAAELRHYFMDGSEETLTLDGFDEAYYAGFPIPKHMVPSYVKGEAAYRQFVILRRGGRVLFYRAETAEDLRGHLSELAETFAQYENA